VLEIREEDVGEEEEVVDHEDGGDEYKRLS